MTKILVIEDEELVRENLLDLLEAENFETISAPNGRIGLDLAVSEIPDLILCDMMMPEIDGYGVLTALRQEPSTAAIPFIFLTAKSAKADFRQGMDMGADDYLTKPFTRAELLSAIMNRLERQAALKKYLKAPNEHKSLSPKMQLLKIDLERVVQKNNFQEFELYYQPIVAIESGQIIAAESLLCWQNPELGLISLTEFISLAESTGLIFSIGKWILQSVSEQMRSWQRNLKSFSLVISVNVSEMEFNHPDLVKGIGEILASNKLEPKYVQIEITESIIMQDINSAIAKLNELKSLGVKITIDDFGMGNSSLIYLKNLPIDAIKIGRYFIHNITTDPQKSANTQALIQMAHNLNLQVVADGVETEAELSFLHQNKCDAMQGLLLSRPLSPGELENFF